jgi:hypothetical protein
MERRDRELGGIEAWVERGEAGRRPECRGDRRGGVVERTRGASSWGRPSCASVHGQRPPPEEVSASLDDHPDRAIALHQRPLHRALQVAERQRLGALDLAEPLVPVAVEDLRLRELEREAAVRLGLRDLLRACPHLVAVQLLLGDARSLDFRERGVDLLLDRDRVLPRGGRLPG